MTVPGAGAGRTGKGIAHVFALAGQEALINGHGARFGVAGPGNRFRKWCDGAGRGAEIAETDVLSGMKRAARRRGLPPFGRACEAR